MNKLTRSINKTMLKLKRKKIHNEDPQRCGRCEGLGRINPYWIRSRGEVTGRFKWDRCPICNGSRYLIEG